MGRIAFLAIVFFTVVLFAYIEYGASFLPSHLAKPKDRIAALNQSLPPPQIDNSMSGMISRTPCAMQESHWRQEFGHPRNLSFYKQ